MIVLTENNLLICSQRTAIIAAYHHAPFAQWRLDVAIRRQGKGAVVRTIWIVRTGESIPRFVTCWVHR